MNLPVSLFLRSIHVFLLPLAALPAFVFEIHAATYEVLKRFDGPASPRSRLLRASDGNYYGTAASGGAGDFGAIYKVTPGGAVSTLANFNYTNGATPYGGVCEGFDGALYGTTRSGGSAGKGTFYRVSLTGAVTKLLDFTGANGANPEATLLRGTDAGNDGFFYGSTYAGGTGDLGTIFRVTPGGTLTTLYHFSGSNGANPTSALLRGTKSNNLGFLYGTTYNGGGSSRGTFFKINTGGALSTLYSFTGSSPVGANPVGELLEGAEGNFYGVTYNGGVGNGSTGLGAIYNITPAGSYTTLRAFGGNGSDGIATGYNPFGGLTLGTDGNYYGTTSNGGPPGATGSIFRYTPSGTLSQVVAMNTTTGRQPLSGLLRDAEGNFLGTTLNPGSFGSGRGSVFKVTSSGAFTNLESFSGPIDGANAVPTLTADAAGTTFYGVASSGGRAFNSPTSVVYAGTVFKIDSAGVFTKLHDFDNDHGGTPQAPLLRVAEAGATVFYGSTSSGGSSSLGTLFKIADGNFTKILDFTGTANGSFPYDKLVATADGKIYGTTYTGGVANLGVIFQLAGGVYSRLFNFTSAATGTNPRGLTLGSDGNLYGATNLGGSNNAGTIFRFTPGGVFTKLFDFTPASTGSSPTTLAPGSDGNLYGTTLAGGAGNVGTLFRFTPAGAFTTLVTFNTANGATPSNLTATGDGLLYGATAGGGNPGTGTLFRYQIGTGTLETIQHFSDAAGGNLGGVPRSAPAVGADGKLYGFAPYLLYRLTPPALPTTPTPPAKVTYSIRAKASPTSRGSVTGAKRYQKGSKVTLRAKPKKGRKFVNWTEGSKTVSKKATYTFVARANRSLVAHFK